MAKLTTHVLDLSRGCPAAGVRIVCFRGEEKIGSALTNADGRVSQPLAEALVIGTHRIEFFVGDYFAKQGHADAKAFLDVVPIVFVVNDVERSYHVPLLITPWSYSTYRGS